MRSLFALATVAAMFGLGALASSAIAESIAQAQPASLIEGGSIAGAARIRAGDINCPHCDLHGADLTKQCVEHGDLSGANFDRAIASGMCLGSANLADATFRNANLTGADLNKANLANADLSGAKLTIANIRNADLSTAKGLTQSQVDLACGNQATRLPAGLTIRFCS
jgi:uncharacterized protein YjbI with pentapeptide repeats